MIGAPAGAASIPPGSSPCGRARSPRYPAGWALCNGANGIAHDLRDKFVVGDDADVAGVAASTVAGAAAQTGGAVERLRPTPLAATGQRPGERRLHADSSPTCPRIATPRCVDLMRDNTAGSTNTHWGTSAGRYVAAGTGVIDFAAVADLTLIRAAA